MYLKVECSNIRFIRLKKDGKMPRPSLTKLRKLSTRIVTKVDLSAPLGWIKSLQLNSKIPKKNYHTHG